MLLLQDFLECQELLGTMLNVPILIRLLKQSKRRSDRYCKPLHDDLFSKAREMPFDLSKSFQKTPLPLFSGNYSRNTRLYPWIAHKSRSYQGLHFLLARFFVVYNRNGHFVFRPKHR